MKRRFELTDTSFSGKQDLAESDMPVHQDVRPQATVAHLKLLGLFKAFHTAQAEVVGIDEKGL